MFVTTVRQHFPRINLRIFLSLKTTTSMFWNFQASDKHFVTAYCQTDEDSNKAVIDKLKGRIDDLEQDLKETKERLIRQQKGDNGSNLDSKGTKMLAFDAKNKVQRFFATLSEQLKINKGRAESVEQRIGSLFEVGRISCDAGEIRTRELEELEVLLKKTHEAEMEKLREKMGVEQTEMVERLTKVSQEETSRKVDETKAFMEEKRQREMKRLHEAAVLERETLVSRIRRENEVSTGEAVREAKRKQWCCNCWQEAFYPCCWNTSYCSRQCQVMNWQQHRIVCSRNFVF